MPDYSALIQALYGTTQNIHYFSHEVRALTERPGLTLVQQLNVQQILTTTSTTEVLKSVDGREVVGVTTEQSAQLLTYAQIMGIQFARPVLY